jgi:hypothetical protein
MCMSVCAARARYMSTCVCAARARSSVRKKLSEVHVYVHRRVRIRVI